MILCRHSLVFQREPAREVMKLPRRFLFGQGFGAGDRYILVDGRTTLPLGCLIRPHAGGNRVASGQRIR